MATIERGPCESKEKSPIHSYTHIIFALYINVFMTGYYISETIIKLKSCWFCIVVHVTLGYGVSLEALQLVTMVGTQTQGPDTVRFTLSVTALAGSCLRAGLDEYRV